MRTTWTSLISWTVCIGGVVLAPALTWAGMPTLALFVAMCGASPLAMLSALKLPKAVVFGAEDTNGGNPAETATRIGAPAPRLIPDANHLTPISNPADVAAAIDRLR